jgi:CubicO group peptidase (beta-lactamase class C family)
MDMAPDRYRFVLGGPIVMEPGKRWVYNGGATAVLARIIEKGSGKPLHEFARETLFDPLGIGPTEWLTDRNDEAIAASALPVASVRSRWLAAAASPKVQISRSFSLAPRQFRGSCRRH